MAAAPVALATSGQAVKALTADLVVIEGRFFRKVKRRVPTGRLTPKGRPGMRTEITLEPVDVSAHLNPVSLAIGVGVGLLGLGAGMWWMGLGVQKIPDETLDKFKLILQTLDEAFPALEAVLLEVRQDQAMCKDLAACLRKCDAMDPWAQAACRARCPDAVAECDTRDDREYSITTHDYLGGVDATRTWKGTFSEIILDIEIDMQMNREQAKDYARKLRAPFSVGSRPRLTDWDIAGIFP